MSWIVNEQVRGNVVAIDGADDIQVERVRRLVTDAGNSFDYHSFPTAPHALHTSDPDLYVETLLEWTQRLAP
jgi:pimeloyl-ACP methyl ester carboxylesterase